MIAQEYRPMADIRDRWYLPHDVADWKTILARDRHVHARHQWEMERHVAFVAFAEILFHVFRPLIDFGE